MGWRQAFWWEGFGSPVTSSEQGEDVWHTAAPGWSQYFPALLQDQVSTEVRYDLWEICCLPCDLPSCTDTLGQTLSGCATRRTDPRCSHLPWERSNPRNQGEKDRFCIAHPAMRSPFHHFPKEAALQVQKVTPQSLLLTPIALGLPSFSLWKLLQWSICFQPTFHFLLTSESESLPIFPFPCRSDCRCYTTKASLFLQKSTPVQYEVL